MSKRGNYGRWTEQEMSMAIGAYRAGEAAPVPGTSKTIQRRQTKTTASAVILTGTPYKETLEEKQRQTDKGNINENKKRKADEESKHKKKNNKKNSQERERKVLPQNKRTRREKSLLDKVTVNLFSEIQNKPKRKPGKKTSPYLTESDEDNDENTEELCLLIC
ncbi:hypothetical protein JTB14_006264 [Gonioctena quinquepunctata]|nr:hypothetical protein JTB14_006264 [Gonioctena quinquepunctata]